MIRFSIGTYKRVITFKCPYQIWDVSFLLLRLDFLSTVWCRRPNAHRVRPLKNPRQACFRGWPALNSDIQTPHSTQLCLSGQLQESFRIWLALYNVYAEPISRMHDLATKNWWAYHTTTTSCMQVTAAFRVGAILKFFLKF